MNFIKDPYIWITCILILFLLITFGLKIDYMNISRIIKNHISNFKDDNNKIPIMVLFLYFVMPLALAWSCVNIKVINDDIVGNITVMLSIITAMLFTLLPMLMELRYKMNDRLKDNPSKLRESKILVRETVDSIMFEVLIAVVLLILSFTLTFPGMNNKVVSCTVYYLLFMFLMNLMIVLKRFYILFKDGINN
ncbi:MAG: hypothetical protein ACLUG9_12680 [Paraclostridium sordellii]